ncbi:hypothetical protein TREMEDRAFT_28441 [Tremella mesenterica DSM 1558]|uniref:uncharacterized protein n=1 Tax=Tremella mesenterica (strain ATCC 24925 / CBS 8224 / DSM 1558 / NBRC 9311 / NRRL Y-6157 / RJB 2259-6 / UBC 559-6) TaxID=578456 RepID=UPI0003F49488|nr:uncharacterized protein TREMEDRAFT_28441 [Tremella mesenterica DSM 1558]EIW70400.1 hypothetical protein TREMEDRAFT_28441 [Tremella mesenterica DSM 1558]
MSTPTLTGDQDAEKQEVIKGAQIEHGHADQHPLAQLSNVRKNVLLLVFSIAAFTDICNISGVGVAVAQISVDIHLNISQVVWIITSYSLCFCAFLLFAGRLSDLFPAQIVFMGGFVGLGIFSLITSFVNHSKYGFLILRGLGGICGAMTIPSSYHLAVHMFPDPEIQKQKLGLLGLSGAIGNVLGLIIAAACMIKSYVWFFRLVCFMCFFFTGLAFLLLPYTGSSYSHSNDKTPRYKRMDIIGVILMMLTLICFILALTQGPIDGWKAASFIAPFILSFPLGIGFFFWESRIDPRSALLPSTVWKITNMLSSSLVILVPMAFYATSQLQYANYFQLVRGWSPIHSAVAILPQGITSLIVGGIVSAAFPKVISTPRITIPVGGTLIIIAEILQSQSNGGLGNDYWRFCFPAFVIGSAGAILLFFASAINLITYCPPEMAGVASAWTQVVAQVGGSVCLAVQAGMETNLAVWKQSGARAFYFLLAWAAVLCFQFLIFYKTPGTPAEEHDATRKRIAASGKDLGVISSVDEPVEK